MGQSIEGRPPAQLPPPGSLPAETVIIPQLQEAQHRRKKSPLTRSSNCGKWGR